MLFKRFLIVFIVLLMPISGIVLAEKCSDFSREDLNMLLDGSKDLIGAQLDGVDLHGKDLRGVNFSGAEMEKVNLKGANLSGANFMDADLEEANLTGANISGANFRGAELEYATWVDGRVCAEDSVGGCW